MSVVTRVLGLLLVGYGNPHGKTGKQMEDEMKLEARRDIGFRGVRLSYWLLAGNGGMDPCTVPMI